MSLATTVKPTVEPWSISEVQDALRVSAADDLVFLASLIPIARAQIETHLRRRLITQTVALTLNRFPPLIEVPVAPVQSVVSITYTDSAGATQTLANSQYQLATASFPNIVAPAYQLVWPTTRADFDSVTITLKVGYGDTGSDVPFDIRQAGLMLMGHFFENRETSIAGAGVKEVPFGARSLLAPHILWL